MARIPAGRGRPGPIPSAHAITAPWEKPPSTVRSIGTPVRSASPSSQDAGARRWRGRSRRPACPSSSSRTSGARSAAAPAGRAGTAPTSRSRGSKTSISGATSCSLVPRPWRRTIAPAGSPAGHPQLLDQLVDVGHEADAIASGTGGTTTPRSAAPPAARALRSRAAGARAAARPGRGRRRSGAASPSAASRPPSPPASRSARPSGCGCPACPPPSRSSTRSSSISPVRCSPATRRRRALVRRAGARRRRPARAAPRRRLERAALTFPVTADLDVTPLQLRMAELGILTG